MTILGGMIDRDTHTHMQCPKCLSLLEYNGHWRYDTLSEHCSNPNAIPPLRSTFKCPNGCHTGFYGITGALYSCDNAPRFQWNAIHSISWRIENWDFWEFPWSHCRYKHYDEFGRMLVYTISQWSHLVIS